jgi:CO/xanthine dehydrogenase Mo-binding subunit
VAPDPRNRVNATGVGASIVRPDAIAKVRGEFEFATDLRAAGMLWGATLRSPHPLARILRVDLTPAKRIPGVRAVLGAWDVPVNRFGAVNKDTPVLADDMVRYVGEPVAIVAAETPALARQAIDAIVVSYEPMRPVTDALEALAAGHVYRHVSVTHGDPDIEGEVQAEGEYLTPRQDHSFLAPDAGLARPDGRGGVEVIGASQWVHADREQIAACLALPEEKVLVVNSGIGGSFGGRVSMTWQVHGALLALHTGRPVKFVYSRRETFLARYHRHPSRIWLRHHANRDGSIVKLEARILLEDGPYSHTAAAGIGNSCSLIQGPYSVPNAAIEGWAVATNNGMCGSMRGFGVVEPIFACESNMDRLARTLGMDGAELRRRNLIKSGDTWTFRQVQDRPAPVSELVDLCQAMPLPPVPPADESISERAGLPGGVATPTRRRHVRRGVGLAAAVKNTCFSEGCPVNSTALLTLQNGIATVDCAAAEVGQGFVAIAIQIVQSTLGVNEVRVAGCDTAMPPAASTDAQQQTITSGPAIHLAAIRLKERFLEFFGREHGLDATTLDIQDDFVVSRQGDRLAAVAEAAMGLVFRATERFDQRTTRPVDDPHAPEPVHVALSFSANRCVVDVDAELGLARVVQMDVVQDAGRVAHPALALGQVTGGSLMGLGFALSESLDYRDGRPVNGDWRDYHLPRMTDAPVVNCRFVESPGPGIPFGFNGIGEMPHVQAPAAILSALRAATGRDLPAAPATAERIALIERDTLPMRLSDSAIDAFKGPGRARIGKFLRFQRVEE